ncbi:MAG: hypothetical protein WC602_02075 [archaeon]
MKADFGFTKKEARLLGRLDSPAKIQRFLDREVKYDLDSHYYSPRFVMKHRKADCLEGAVFAASALRFHGRKPLLVDLESVLDEDHVLAVYKINGLWGSIAQSKFMGLRFRNPVYRSVRELVMSYFESYFNFRCEMTLRGYSAPVNLEMFDQKSWMTTEKPIAFIEDFLAGIRHKKVLPEKSGKFLLNRTKAELERSML